MQFSKCFAALLITWRIYLGIDHLKKWCHHMRLWDGEMIAYLVKYNSGISCNPQIWFYLLSCNDGCNVITNNRDIQRRGLCFGCINYRMGSFNGVYVTKYAKYKHEKKCMVTDLFRFSPLPQDLMCVIHGMLNAMYFLTIYSSTWLHTRGPVLCRISFRNSYKHKSREISFGHNIRFDRPIVWDILHKARQCRSLCNILKRLVYF